jgi:hypothetical protein
MTHSAESAAPEHRNSAASDSLGAARVDAPARTITRDSIGASSKRMSLAAMPPAALRRSRSQATYLRKRSILAGEADPSLPGRPIIPPPGGMISVRATALVRPSNQPRSRCSRMAELASCARACLLPPP